MTDTIIPGEVDETGLESEPMAVRGMVPTPRERLAGKDAVYRPVQTAAGPVTTRRQLIRTYIAGLNPLRATSGRSAVPMLVVAGTGFFGAVDAGAGILIPEMRRDLGVSITTMTAVFTALAVWSSFLGYGAAYVGDRFPRTRMLAIGNAGFALGQFFTSRVHTALEFLGVQGASRLLSSPNLTVSAPLLADFYPPESRGRVYSFQSIVGIGGTLVGPVVAGILGDRMGWRPVFVILTIPALILGFAILLLKEPKRGAEDGGAVSRGEAEPLPAPGLAETLRICAGISTLRRLWAAQVLTGLGAGGIYILLVFYVADTLHVSATNRGLLAAFSGVAAIIGLLVAGPLVDTFMTYKPGRVMSLIGVVLIINMVLLISMSVVTFLPWILTVLFLLPLINAPLSPASSTVQSLVIPARIRATGMQTVQLFGLLGTILLPVVAAIGGVVGPLTAIAMLSPIFLLGAFLTMSAATQVDPDIRAALAANVAEEESRRVLAEGQRRKLLVCRDVDVQYDGVQILFHVDFDIEEGEMVALLGTNGAGKSTLLRAITGLTEASNGAIFFDGLDVTHAPPYLTAQRGIVLMPGGKGVFPGMTVDENLRAATWLSLRAEDGGSEARRRRVLDEFFPQLKARLGQKAGSLSGGEQQMLALGQAFVMNGKLLLIDELSLGLAPAVVEQLLGVLREIRAAGTTVLIVEQSVELALRIADRAVFMEKGEVRFMGPAEELRTRPDLLRSVFLKGGGGGAIGGAAPARRPQPTAAARPEPVLVADGIYARYGGVLALRGARVSVAQGEIVGIIGPNGAGKTTLFDTLSGFLPVERGSVLLAGKDVTMSSPDQRARLGLTRAFQDARLFPTLTVRETILTAMEKQVVFKVAAVNASWLPASRRSEAKLSRRAERIMEMFSLQPFADRFVQELSTGMRRVLDLAAVLAAEPDVILLDEPSSGLAQAETEELGPLLRRVQREAGCGLVVIEHDMRLITSISDHMIAMDLGEVIAEGNPQEVINNELVVAAYLGAAAKGEKDA